MKPTIEYILSIFLFNLKNKVELAICMTLRLKAILKLLTTNIIYKGNIDLTI